jgi:hypothetical protein
MLRSAPSLNRESSKFFFFKMPPAACLSSYVSETNMVAKVIDSTINRNPCQTRGNQQNSCFPSIPGDYPLSNGHPGLFKTQLTVSLR